MKKKQPSDYPQFYCRMKQEDKDEIEAIIDRIVTHKKKKVAENEILPKRNDYIVKALKIGLKDLAKKELK